MARLPPLRLARYSSAKDFLATAGAYLQAREAEHNLILGLAGTLRDEPGGHDQLPPLLATVTDGERVVAVALRTPPRNLILSEVDMAAAVTVLADGLAGEELPGVVGPPEAVRLFAERWTERTGDAWQVQLEERIFRLRRVVAPRPTSGAIRAASVGDRDLVIDWIGAFEREALPEQSPATQLAESVDRSLARVGHRFFLWEDPEPVSVVGVGGGTPNGIRIGPVYTPPRFRGRGYASALTAAVSQAMLDSGRRFCFLYTDLANPTSNRIYTAIGYEPVTDALMVGFTPPRAA